MLNYSTILYILAQVQYPSYLEAFPTDGLGNLLLQMQVDCKQGLVVHEGAIIYSAPVINPPSPLFFRFLGIVCLFFVFVYFLFSFLRMSYNA